MKLMSWNCRGLNASNKTVVPYMYWLIAHFSPTFLFLQETKTTVDNVYDLLRPASPTLVHGVDAVGSRGGLVVFCWGPFVTNVLCSSQNFIFCQITSSNGNMQHVMFVYGKSQVSQRPQFWFELQNILSAHPNLLIMGDINQLDSYEDKIGGAPLIRGWEDFQEWKNSLLLQDIPFYGPRFTWSNAREGDDLILERLDRAYATQEWLADYPHAILRNFPITVSDHAPILLQTSPPTMASKRPYQIETWCLQAPATATIIREVWQAFIPGSPMYVLAKKLFMAKERMKTWCLDRRLFRGVNWNSIFQQLQSQGDHLDNLDQGNSYMREKSRLLDEASLGILYWKQRVRNRHICMGELPSKLMFQRVRQRKNHRHIYMLKNEDGMWIDDQTEIVRLISQHFNLIFNPGDNRTLSSLPHAENIDLLLRELNLPQLSDFQVQTLAHPFTAMEIQEAFFALPNDKSPGTDGFPVEFFRHHWQLVGDSVIRAIQHFFATGFMLKEWNRTLLILVPKCDPPEEVNHLRPISLCNVVYKCVSRCMVNRLKPLLPALIDDFQNAFIPGRHMNDNILISHELMHLINKQRAGTRHLGAVKIDMNKAYDRVSWLFILKVLKAYGFPDFWIALVKQCITTVTYKIVINGTVTNSFIPTCGLRQGDPLSPYLFLFCMDILSRMTTLAAEIKAFQGIKLRRQGPSLTHLFFADDALFFLKMSDGNCNRLSSMLTRFCNVSGQVLNLQKSFVKFSPNISTEQQQRFKSLLRMQAHSNMGTYLGIPFDIQDNKVPHFTPLLDKISSRIAQWHHHKLSQSMKLIVINSILIASLINHLSIFRIPSSITHKIDSMIGRFFWGSVTTRGIHWRDKAHIQLPKGVGGLGIRNVGLLNTAMLMKTVTRMKENPQLLLSKTYRDSQSNHFRVLSKGQHLSWGRRGLCQADKILCQGCAWKVGNGTSILASSTKWVHGSIPILKDDVRLREANSLKVVDLLDPATNEWNVHKLYKFFTSDSANLIRTVELPPPHTTPDHLYWPLTTSGKFSTKSGYFFLLTLQQNDINSMTDSQSTKFFRTLWGLNIMPKWKLFLWKLRNNAIATKYNIFKRHIGNDAACPICLHAEETLLHLFITCPLAEEVWLDANPTLHITAPTTESFEIWLQTTLLQLRSTDGYNGYRLPLFVGRLWSIWTSRNAQVFRRQRVTMEIFRLHLAENLADHDIFLSEINHHPTGQASPITPPGFLIAQLGSLVVYSPEIILQCDGSWDHKTNRGGAAWVAVSPAGEVRDKGGTFIWAVSALAAEALASLKAIQWATERGFSRVTIHTDSALLVNLLRKVGTGDISIGYTIDNIRTTAGLLLGCNVLKVQRASVSLANDLAKDFRQNPNRFCGT